MKLYAKIAQLTQAIRNCEKSGNAEWIERHIDSVESLVHQYMPSGSGFDSGTKIALDECTPARLVFETEFHHMNDVGMYDGWTNHSVIVKPEFYGISIRITGRSRNDIKDYMADVFHQALTVDVE